MSLIRVGASPIPGTLTYFIKEWWMTTGAQAAGDNYTFKGGGIACECCDIYWVVVGDDQEIRFATEANGVNTTLIAADPELFVKILDALKRVMHRGPVEDNS